MGCLGATVHFLTAPPTVEALLSALREHIGEPVYYEPATQCLSCPATGDAAGFEAARQLQQRILSLDLEVPDAWGLLNPNLKGGYLWFATLVVLQKLGGTSDWKLPTWAFKPWRLAWQEQKRLFVRSLTYDEARRLGVE